MREIKFRGRTPKGEWLYGDLHQWSNGDVYIGTQNEAWTDDGYPHTDDYLSITKVNENTVGQFTDLYDKNGKEIYEGDIVRHVNRQVKGDNGKWEDDSVVFVVKYEEANFNISYYSRVTDSLEVIGNIYDNP